MLMQSEQHFQLNQIREHRAEEEEEEEAASEETNNRPSDRGRNPCSLFQAKLNGELALWFSVRSARKAEGPIRRSLR